MGLREDILGASDLPVEAVAVPEWGTVVHVRTLTGAERDAFEEGCLAKAGKGKTLSLKNVRARLVVLAACRGPEDRSPLFQPGDEAALGAKSGKALDRLYDAASRLAGLSEKDIEELAGN